MRLPTSEYLKMIVEFYDEVEKVGVHVKSKGHYVDYWELITDLGAVWNNLPNDTKAHLALLYAEVALNYDISKAKKLEKHKTKVPLNQFLRPVYLIREDMVYEHLAFDFKTKKFEICGDLASDKWHVTSTFEINIDTLMRFMNRYKFRPCDSVDEFLRQKFETKMIGGKLSGTETQILLLGGE